MEKIFPAENNKLFSDSHFGYLYLEDSISETDCQIRTLDHIKNFFGYK